MLVIRFRFKHVLVNLRRCVSLILVQINVDDLTAAWVIISGEQFKGKAFCEGRQAGVLKHGGI